MSYSFALKLFLGLALPLTLAWKLGVTPDDTRYLEGDIAQFLARQKLDATATQEMMDHFPIIRAENEACRMQIMKASYYGVDRDTIRSLSRPDDRLIFIYRGKVYAEQPVWQIVSDQIWMRFLRSVRLAVHEPPVLAIAAAPACNAERMPWDQLS